MIVALAAMGAVFAYNKLNAARARASRAGAIAHQRVFGRTSSMILTATGYIIAAHKIEVASKVNGRVAWIGVDKGDKVQAGQVWFAWKTMNIARKSPSSKASWRTCRRSCGVERMARVRKRSRKRAPT